MKIMQLSLSTVSLLILLLAFAPACSDSSSTAVAPPPEPGVVPSPTPSVFPSPVPSPSPSPSIVAVTIPAGSVGLGPAAYGVNPLVIAVGTTVIWSNSDTLPHTVTADDGSFGSGTMQTGGTFEHVFEEAGTFPYHCEIHGQTSMSGVVQVTASTQGG